MNPIHSTCSYTLKRVHSWPGHMAAKRAKGCGKHRNGKAK